MKKILLISWVLILSACTSKKTVPQIEQPVSIPVKHYDTAEINPASYDDINDYVNNDREQFKKYLDEYWARLPRPASKTKEQLIQEFDERTIRNYFINWTVKCVNEFNNMGFSTHEGELFRYYFLDRKKGKTFFYIHGNFSPMTLWMEFSMILAKRFSEYNIVLVSSSKLNQSESNFSADQMNVKFETDTLDFIKSKNLDLSKSVFNVVRHASLYTYSFFKNNSKNLYAVIYNSPRIKKAKKDLVPDFKYVFGDKKRFVSFHDIYYLHSINSKLGSKSFAVPVIDSKFNLENEKALNELYFKGIDIRKIKNKFLIYASDDTTMVPESFSLKSFNPKNVKKLAGMLHHDYYTNEEKSELYFQAIEKFIELQPGSTP